MIGAEEKIFGKTHSLPYKEANSAMGQPSNDLLRNFHSQFKAPPPSMRHQQYLKQMTPPLPTIQSGYNRKIPQ